MIDFVNWKKKKKNSKSVSKTMKELVLGLTIAHAVFAILGCGLFFFAGK